MTTAMAVYHSGGEAGRCDANCHEAHEPACDCCCGGRLHGRGSSQAAIEQQTVDFFGSLEAAELWAKAHGIQRPQVKAPQLARRRSLTNLLAAERRARAPRQLTLEEATSAYL
jgi:hypothetical protein